MLPGLGDDAISLLLEVAAGMICSLFTGFIVKFCVKKARPMLWEWRWFFSKNIGGAMAMRAPLEP